MSFWISSVLTKSLTDRFQDVFTPEELFAIWEVWNFNGYLSMGRSPMTDNKGCLSTAAILRDMIECADRDLLPETST